jgi:hypothetical protein
VPSGLHILGRSELLGHTVMAKYATAAGAIAGSVIQETLFSAQL